MATKCKRPPNMKFGMGEGPFDTVVDDKPVMLQAFGLPDGVTIEIFLSETDGGPDKAACYDYCEPAIDPCTGLPAVLSATNTMTVLNAHGTYKMEIVGAEIEEIKDTVGVFCYDLAGNVSLLLKKADATPGPAGPPGADGADGAEGPPGPQLTNKEFLTQLIAALNDPACEAEKDTVCEILNPGTTGTAPAGTEN